MNFTVLVLIFLSFFRLSFFELWKFSEGWLRSNLASYSAFLIKVEADEGIFEEMAYYDKKF